MTLDRDIDPTPAIALPARLRAVAAVVRAFEARGALADELDALGPSVAIVGTRSAPHAAETLAYAIARHLARAGVVIVSGGAVGIDAAAHRGALDAGGKTIVVLPGGIDVFYPRAHRSLFEHATERGALVAIQPRGTPPRPGYFLARNRVIAALADAVVLVAAPLASGARSTVAAARRLGRPVHVVPAAPWDEAGAGCAAELLLGASPILDPMPLLDLLDIESARSSPSTFAADIAGVWARGAPPTSPTPRLPAATKRPADASQPTKTAAPSIAIDRSNVSEDDQPILSALENKAVSLDELVLSTGRSVASLRVLLLTWTVEGLVSEGPAGAFRLRKP